MSMLEFDQIFFLYQRNRFFIERQKMKYILEFGELLFEKISNQMENILEKHGFHSINEFIGKRRLGGGDMITVLSCWKESHEEGR